jgi:hypothetical protein
MDKEATNSREREREKGLKQVWFGGEAERQ